MEKDPYVEIVKQLPRVKEFYYDKATAKIKTAMSYLSALVKLNRYLEKELNCNCHTIIDKLRKKNKDFDVYDLLRRYVSYLPTVVEGITSSTIVNYVGALCSYFEFYDIDTHRRKSKVRLPKIPKKKKTPIDAGDIRKLLIACRNPRLKAYLAVLASSGMRADSEACTIRNCDVDYSSSPTNIHIRAEYTKTLAERTVFISDEATYYLKLWKDPNNREPEQLLFSAYRNSIPLTFEDTDRVASNIYVRLQHEFVDLLELVRMDQREDYGKVGKRRHKLTLHSFRRFTSTTIENNSAKGYHDFILGHADGNSTYHTQKEEKIVQDYLKVMPFLTFLDFTALETKGKDFDTKMEVKDLQIAELNKQVLELKEKEEDREKYLRSVTEVAQSYLRENDELLDRVSKLEKLVPSEEETKRIDTLYEMMQEIRKKK